MSTKSNLLALTLAAAAVAILTPALAKPPALSSPHPGGLKVIMPAKTNPVVATTKFGGATLKLPPAKVIPAKPVPGVGTKVAGNTTLKIPPWKVVPAPPPPPKPPTPPNPPSPSPPGKGPMAGKWPHPGGMWPYPGGIFAGPVVVATPSAPVEAPTATVPAPSVAPGPMYVAQGKPVIPHCTAIPPLAVMLDQLLPTAQLAQADMEKVAALRAQIADLAQAGNETAARAVEEQAMNILGYGKIWLRCGPGTFFWGKQPPASGANAAL